MSGYVLLSEPRSWAGIAGASAIVVAAITEASAGLIPHPASAYDQHSG